MRGRNPVPDPAPCPGCGEPILVGWYGPRPLALDEQALNLAGEAQALVCGRRTFEVSGFGVLHRGAEAIRFVPSPKITDIHREHRCGSTPITEAEKRPPKPAPYRGSEPPF